MVMQELLIKGDAVLQMMQVTGEEGVTLEDFITYQKAQFIDMVYLQQDAFDAVYALCSLARQKRLFNLIRDYVLKDYSFADKAAAREFFTRLTGKFKNFNYAEEDTPLYSALLRKLTQSE